MRFSRSIVLLAICWFSAGLQAQSARPADRELCAALPPAATNARTLALRSHCVLAGLTPSDRRHAEARELARRSLQLGDPAGGFLLYLAFGSDPENHYLQDGKPDMAAYRRLGSRTLEQRTEQIEALDGLAFAASKGHVNAALALASYFHETSAPDNLLRLRNLTALLMRNGERAPALQRLAQQAAALHDLAPATKASPRAFLDAMRTAGAAVALAYMAQSEGRTCERPALKAVNSGDVRDPVYLPLTHPSVQNTYLVRGEWAEQWIFLACDRQLAIKVTFRADGWGGASFTAEADKGS